MDLLDFYLNDQKGRKPNCRLCTMKFKEIDV